jgi:hypothetical protein
MQGNRLIGYLYLGYHLPDSLAFKRMIDDAIPIHNVSILLHRNFDARAYIAGHQAQHLWGRLA